MTPEKLQEIALYVRMHGVQAALEAYPDAAATIDAVGRSYNLVTRKFVRWHPEWDVLLDSNSDDEVLAARLRVPVETVTRRRKSRMVTVSGGGGKKRKRWIRWRPEWDVLLDGATDTALAKQLGVTVAAVAWHRGARRKRRGGQHA
jgi:hypothetical protein